MAATTLTEMPSAIFAGDTLLLEVGGGDYPANESWVLTFDFRKKDGALVQFSSTANGAAHAFSVDKDTTGTWIPGQYKGVAYVDNGTQRFVVWEGILEVKPNYAIQNANYDTRSSARKCLDAINSVLEGKASRDVLSTVIAGQSISRMSYTELLAAKAHFESIVRQEEAQLAADSGKSTGNHILARFGRS